MGDSITPGFRFKEGKLYIFEPSGVTILHAWPELRGVRKASRDPEWKPFAPLFRVVVPYRRSAKTSRSPQRALELGAVDQTPTLPQLRKRAFDSFRFAMPKPAAARVERFQNMQWRVLKLFEAETLAMEVCKSNPALVFCLANARSLLGRHIPIPTVARLIQRRQRDLLEYLGVPTTESNARTLAKLIAESVSFRSVQAVVNLLRNEDTRKSLNHLPQINSGVLAILIAPALRAVCSPALLEEVSKTRGEHYRGVTAQKLADIQHMTDLMEKPVNTRHYSTRRDVNADHARLSLEFSRCGMLDATGIHFGRPPIPGTPQIRPIRTPAELEKEGRLQGNCVGSYVERVQAGRVYIYRVVEPERATLSLFRGECGHWEIDQLLASHNRKVQPKTRTAVSEWLGQYAIRA